MGDQNPDDVYRVSAEAFAIARRAVGGGDPAPLGEAARAVNARLDALLPAAQAAEPADPGVMRAWSDARLDVGWVLSGGQLSPSTRLAAHIAQMRPG
jgi:hypothetical protein